MLCHSFYEQHFHSFMRHASRFRHHRIDNLYAIERKWDQIFLFRLNRCVYLKCICVLCIDNIWLISSSEISDFRRNFILFRLLDERDIARSDRKAIQNAFNEELEMPLKYFRFSSTLFDFHSLSLHARKMSTDVKNWLRFFQQIKRKKRRRQNEKFMNGKLILEVNHNGIETQVLRFSVSCFPHTRQNSHSLALIWRWNLP